MKHPRRRVGQPWAPIYSETPTDWKEERKGMARFGRDLAASLAGLTYILAIGLGLLAALYFLTR